MNNNLIEKHIQNIFGCSSANFDKYPELWMQNIELYIPQVFNFIELTSNYKSNIIQMDDIIYSDSTLKSLFKSYGSDKDNFYYPLYTNILDKRRKIENLRLLEIGLGTNDPTIISTMGNSGIHNCGGSLRSFRDYLPNSKIFGGDVDKKCLFKEDNIDTFFVDQLELETFDNLYKNCGNLNFDIIIDDGLHSIGANLNTLIFALKSINSNGVIIIEDIPTTKIKAYQIVDYILTNSNKYKTSFITYNNNNGFIYLIETL
jgi:hypothetical protein